MTIPTPPTDVTPHLPFPIGRLEHNVIIHDDAANWLRWGQLILDILSRDKNYRPHTAGALQKEMDGAHVKGWVRADPGRGVDWPQYSEKQKDSIVIPLPHATMVEFDRRLLAEIGARGQGERSYPLPVFYNAIFGGGGKVDFSTQELRDMGLRRLGEYVINQCC